MVDKYTKKNSRKLMDVFYVRLQNLPGFMSHALVLLSFSTHNNTPHVFRTHREFGSWEQNISFFFFFFTIWRNTNTQMKGLKHNFKSAFGDLSKFVSLCSPVITIGGDQLTGKVRFERRFSGLGLDNTRKQIIEHVVGEHCETIFGIMLVCWRDTERWG